MRLQSPNIRSGLVKTKYKIWIPHSCLCCSLHHFQYQLFSYFSPTFNCIYHYLLAHRIHLELIYYRVDFIQSLKSFIRRENFFLLLFFRAKSVFRRHVVSLWLTCCRSRNAGLRHLMPPYSHAGTDTFQQRVSLVTASLLDTDVLLDLPCGPFVQRWCEELIQVSCALNPCWSIQVRATRAQDSTAYQCDRCPWMNESQG